MLHSVQLCGKHVTPTILGQHRLKQPPAYICLMCIMRTVFSILNQSTCVLFIAQKFHGVLLGINECVWGHISTISVFNLSANLLYLVNISFSSYHILEKDIHKSKSKQMCTYSVPHSLPQSISLASVEKKCFKKPFNKLMHCLLLPEAQLSKCLTV